MRQTLSTGLICASHDDTGNWLSRRSIEPPTSIAHGDFMQNTKYTKANPVYFIGNHSFEFHIIYSNRYCSIFPSHRQIEMLFHLLPCVCDVCPAPANCTKFWMASYGYSHFLKFPWLPILFFYWLHKMIKFLQSMSPFRVPPLCGQMSNELNKHTRRPLKWLSALPFLFKAINNLYALRFQGQPPLKSTVQPNRKD